MLAPPPLPRTLEASFRDSTSRKAEARASAIVDLVRHARADDGVRADAVVLLGRALGDEAPMVRSAAAVALGDLLAGEALPGLLVAIEDVDPVVRQMAINALGEIGDARAAARLSRALSDERPEVRYQAVIAFPRVAGGDREGVAAALDRALGDGDESVRYIALRVAEERSDAGLPEPLLVARAKRLLEDAAHHVALAAAIFVAKSGEPEGRGLILRVANGDGPRLRGPAREDENEAILVAGALRMKEAVPALERRAWGLARLVSDTCAWSAKTALARMGHARAVAEILADLGSKKRTSVEAAVAAAGKARLSGAREALRALGPEDADPDLVARALGELEDALAGGASETP